MHLFLFDRLWINPAPRAGARWLVMLLLLALAANGCVKMPRMQPKAEAKSLLTKPDTSEPMTPTALQSAVMRFADDYYMAAAQAADDFAAALGTHDARYVAVRIKLGQATAAVVNAAGHNPAVNALDMVVLATVSRMVAEDYLVGERFGEAARPLVEVATRHETNAWLLVKRVLKSEQQQELRELIHEWRQQNPTRRYIGSVRFQEFTDAIGRTPPASNVKPTSVFSLLFLDPMAGLDPTVRAVEETRYLAERALYYGQRMPILLSWHAELLTLQLAEQPAAQQMLTNLARVTVSMQTFAKTAEQLPQLVDRQRDAAIQQIFAGLANERSNILASLASEEKKMRELLAETRGTFNAAKEMAGSAQGAIQALDTFVRYVAPRPTNTAAPPVKADEKQRPFDVLDYGTAAGQVDGMAKTLNTLLTTVNQNLPQVTQLGQQAGASAADVVHRAFWLGVVLILLLLVGAVLAALAYRLLSNKFLRRAPVSGSILAVAGLSMLQTSCVAPIGADKTTTAEAYHQVHNNPVSHAVPSRETRSLLHRFEQGERFEKQPDETLQAMQKRAVETKDRGLLFALAELNYLAGERLRRSVKPWEPRDARDYYLASAAYAWLFLFGDAASPPAGPFDARFRTACDLYNYALGWALTERRSTNAIAVLAGGPRRLPSGQINLEFKQTAFPWELSRFDHFAIADRYCVRGLSVRNRQPGLGTPLVAATKAEGMKGLPRTVPATVLLRLHGGLPELAKGDLRGSLELYSTYDATTVQVGDQSVPLETDTTIPTAYALNQSFVWRLGMMQFLSAEERIPTDVYLTQPYRSGRVPVVFVHGTFSSPVWWAEMANTLSADPLLRQRYQFWYFIYNSGNPIVYSAERLREALAARIQELDPEGKDAALRQMVVIGHSQGGLLTKLTATDTGDKLLTALLKTNVLRQVNISGEEEALVRHYTCYQALPFVKRVIFICTPHRGSYLAGNFVRNLGRRFVRLPSTVVKRASQISGVTEKLGLPRQLRGSPTSLDSMSPKNPFLLALADIPLAPSVKGHSIIAVEGDGDHVHGKDGLVTYASAHLDYTESEFIVRSFHSCQHKPPTIEEVRRILHEHLNALPAGPVAKISP